MRDRTGSLILSTALAGLAVAAGCARTPRDARVGSADKNAGERVSKADSSIAVAVPYSPRGDHGAYARLDVQANAFTASRQDAVAIAQDRRGRTVAVWQSRRQESGTYGIFARQIDVLGRPIGREVHVNTHTDGSQMRPVVSVDASGAAWFAWESFGQDGSLGAVIARRFDASLSALTPETRIHGDSCRHQSDVALDATADGRAVVVWTSWPDGSATSHIFARWIGADGAPLGDAFPVDAGVSGRNRLPCVGVDAVGTVVIVWARSDVNGRPTGIIGRRFDPHGIALGDEFELNAPDGLMHIEPALDVEPSGAFVAAWATAEGEDYGISVRRFGHDGTPVTGAERVDQGRRGRTTGVAVATRGDGRYVVAWTSHRDANHGSGLFARRYDAQGEPECGVFRVSASPNDGQHLAAATGSRRVVYSRDGRMAFAWAGDAGGDDSSAANVTLLFPAGYQAPPATRLAVAKRDRIPAGPSAAEPHVPPTFDPDAPRIDRASLAIAAQGGSGVDFGFVGIVDTGWTPPDPHMAVGPEHIVLITNGEIAFFDKNGNMTFQDEIENGFGFWGSVGAGGFVFDPEVVYDPDSGRFFAMANERFPPPPQTATTPYFLLAVSDDSDPNGAWHKYRFNVLSEASDTDIDSPNIAVDDQAVYLSADFFGPDKYLLFMLDKAPLLSGDTPGTTSLLMPGFNSLALASSFDNPPAQYMIEAFLTGTNNSVRIHAVTDPLGTPQRESVLVSVPPYQQPEDAPSMGTSVRVETFEARFWSCMYRNGSLWATHHVGAGRVRQRWYQFKMNDWPVGGTPELVQWGEIDPGPGIRTYYGSIWADAFDNAALVFSRSSPTEFISIGRAGRLATDPLGEMQPMVIMHESTGPSFSGRWGDYSAVVTDPAVPGKFWGFHEFMTSLWMTWVDSFAMADVAPPVVASADPFDGYIDPRRESTDGVALDQGMDHVTITFDEPVFNVGGTPLDATAFDLSVSGGVNPGIASIDASANPTVVIQFGGVLPVQQFSTVAANLEDSSGNAAAPALTYGFLPADINQDATVNPLDLLRFKQIVNDVFTPPQGAIELFADIDRSGSVSPLDLLAFKQLINGVGSATQSWAGQSLP